RIAAYHLVVGSLVNRDALPGGADITQQRDGQQSLVRLRFVEANRLQDFDLSARFMLGRLDMPLAVHFQKQQAALCAGMVYGRVHSRLNSLSGMIPRDNACDAFTIMARSR